MTQLALYIVAINLWAVLVWAAAAALSRGAPGLAAWPAYWTGAVAVIVAPWLVGFLVPDAALGLVAAGAGAGIDALSDVAPRAAGWAMTEAFAWAGMPVAEAATSAAPAATPSVMAAPFDLSATEAALASAAPLVSAPRLDFAAPAAAFAPAAEAAAPWLRRALAGLAAIYAAGALWVCGLRVAAHVRLRLLAHGAPRMTTSETVHPVYLVEGAAPPCALGFPDARILIPARMLGTIAPADLSMILRHESAHIDRRDPEATLLLSLIGALFWLNPAVRAIVNRWRLAAEMRADAAVAAGQPRARRMEYARLLVTALRNGRAAPLAAPSAALRLDQKGSVKMRLAAILDSGAPRGAAATRLLAGAAGVALATAGALGCAALAQTVPAATPAPVADPVPLAPLPAPAPVQGAQAVPAPQAEPQPVQQAAPQPARVAAAQADAAPAPLLPDAPDLDPAMPPDARADAIAEWRAEWEAARDARRAEREAAILQHRDEHAAAVAGNDGARRAAIAEARAERAAAIAEARAEREEQRRARQAERTEWAAERAEWQAEFGAAQAERAQDFAQDWSQDWAAEWGPAWAESWTAEGGPDFAGLAGIIQHSVANAGQWAEFGAAQGAIWGQYGGRMGEIEGRVGRLMGRVGSLEGRLAGMEHSARYSAADRAEVEAALEQARRELEQAEAQRERDLAALEAELQRDLADLEARMPALTNASYDYDYDYGTDGVPPARILEGGPVE